LKFYLYSIEAGGFYILIFWFMTLCSLVVGYQERAGWKIKAADFSKVW